MKEKKEFKIFFIISFLIITVLVLYIFRPLLNTILLGFVFAFLFFPLYKAIWNKTKRPRLSAFIVCLLFILIITIPLIFAINSLAVEVFSLSNKFSEKSIVDRVKEYQCNSDSHLCSFIGSILKNSVVNTISEDLFNDAIQNTKKYIGELLVMLPSVVLQVFIVIFMMYYLFIDGEIFIYKIRCFLPLSEEHKSKIFSELKKMMDGVLFGSIVVGAIQGTLGGLGFFIFGIKSPILWGVIMFLFSFLPFIGTGVVWAPASLYVVLSSIFNYDNTGIYRGIGLFIYCILIVSTVDNFIRPKLVSDRTRIHPVLVLFGVLGGLIVFNAAGVIIGPMILGIFITLLEIYDQERNRKCIPNESLKNKNFRDVENLKNKKKRIKKIIIKENK